MTEKQADPIVEKLHEAENLVRSAIAREPRNFEIQDCKIAIWNALDKIARATTVGAVEAPCSDSPDGNHHVAPIGSDEEYLPSRSPCYYCGDKQVSWQAELLDMQREDRKS